MDELKRSAWLIAAAALVPLLLFLLLQSGFNARQERSDVESRALATSQALIVAADGEARRTFTGLDALATARSLRAGDLAEFRSRAAELTALNRDWRAISLVDLDTGRTVMTVGPQGIGFTAVETVARSLKPRFAGYARGPGCPCLMFDRIAISAPGTHRLVRLFVSTDGLNALLPPGRGRYEVSSISDSEGRFIARSIGGTERFGKVGSRYLQQAVATGHMVGTYRGITLEGYPNFTGFTRSKVTGWSAHVALGTQFIDNPARRFLASIGSAALLALLLAGVLLWAALRQIAEGRRIAERMQQAQKLEALGQLTGGLAHDFNNLLTPVIGALDFVGRKPSLDPSSKRLLDGALASARRAGKLTGHLLAFSRQQKLLIEPIHIASMLEDMSDLLHQSAGGSVRLEIVHEDRSLCVLGDLTQLELAILNLVLNARDASPPNGLIRIAVTGSGTVDGGEVAIRVRDEGAGMDEATRLRAFEPFFTTKPLGRGTGLGLAQVFGMATQSGGRVTIDSSPDGGTEVTLVLVRCPAAAARDVAAVERAPANGRSLRLLAVDDDPHVRLAIVRPLEDAGHEVDAVSDGPTALAALAERSFDLVLVDFAMPGMNGAEFIRRARDIRSAQRFLMVTGYADSDAVSAAAPDTPLIRKPFDSQYLIDAVARFAG